MLKRKVTPAVVFANINKQYQLEGQLKGLLQKLNVTNTMYVTEKHSLSLACISAILYQEEMLTLTYTVVSKHLC